MLKLYNKEHVAIDTLTDTKDLKIEYVLSGEDLLEFSLSISDEKINLLEEEGYIRTKDNEYVIKAIDPSDNFKRFSCNINVEALVGKAIASFDTSNNNVNDTIRLAIAGTGWILADNNITKRRTVRLTNTNALEVLREVRKVFRVDIRYDAINKIIYVYEQFGEDRGVYFSDELNLKSFSIPSDTYDYVTRLYPKGKDGLTIASINNGKEYIENFQYSNKVLELIWEDNRYTDVNSLKEDAEVKLDELSKPKRTYQASISDLAKQSEEYNFLDFFLGDTITLLSKQEKFRDKQRIVKYIQYPDDPSQNSCELGNTTLTFEELQKENEAKNNTIDAIASDNGTIDGSKVENLPAENITNLDVEVAKIVNLEAISIKVNKLEAANVTITGKLNAIEGEFGTLKANIATIDKITVTHTAQINNLEAKKASIVQLEAVFATIGTVEAEVAKIQTLVNGNLTSENIHSLHLTSASVTVENRFIKNAMIENLDVSKVNAGDISTNKFRIKSDDGGIEIVGATQQFKDKNNKVRVQIGRDKNNNFTFSLFDETGVGVLIDHTGIKKGAIANDLIVSDMIASDSVGEKQINYSSFVTGFNKDANTNTIKSTKIMLNNQNQTLDIAFNSIKTQVDTTKALTESHSTTIGIMQGQISTAINNTQIVKDGQTILLKDDYNRTVQTIDSMKNTISSHTSQISGLNSTVSTQGSSINQLKSQIALKVEQTDITTAVNNMHIGTRNYILKSSDQYKTVTFSGWQSDISSRTLASMGLKAGDIVTFRFYVKTGSNEILAMLKFGADNGSYTEISSISSLNLAGINTVLANNEGYVTITCEIPSVSLATGNTTTNPIGQPITNVTFRIRHRTNTLTSTVQYKEAKFEKGNKVTDWTPAPEDVDSSISSIDSKITTTNNKVSSIETNLSSITSRVSNVESKQTTVDGKVSSLETRMSTTESKITESAITNTVKKNFYTKSETDSAITSKGYQTASQVQQTVDKFEVKFEESGGYSLLRNSAFKDGTNQWKTLRWDTSGGGTCSTYVEKIGSLYTPTNRNSICTAVRNIPSDSSNIMRAGFDSEYISCNANTVYTFSALFAMHRATKGILELICYDSNNKRLSITTTEITQKSGGKDRKNWTKITKSFTTHANASFILIRVYMDRYTGSSPNSAVIWMLEPILLNGNYSDIMWTPNSDEVYTGITTIDKDGITITNTSSSTYTQIDSESFRVEDNNGGTVAEFSRESTIPKLTAGTITANEIYAGNVCSKSPKAGDIKFIYVNGSTGNDNNAGTQASPYKTVQRAIDDIKDKQDQSVTIYVYNSVPGFDLKGVTGTGVITFSLQDSTVINGFVILGGVTNSIRITNESGSLKSTFKNGISIYRCMNVDIYGVTFRGVNAQGNNIYIQDTNYCAVNSCDLGGLSTQLLCAIRVQSSLLWIHGCRGSNITDVVGQYAFSHVMMARGGTSNVPDYSNVLICNYDGAGRIQNWTGGTFTKTPSSGWNPAYTPTQKTQTWSFNKIWSDETLNGWSDRQELIQGYASTWNTGRWTGYMQFTDGMAAIRSAISGGTNFSGRLYVQRRTSSGNSTGSKLCLYASDGTLITNSTSINRGQGVWVTLSSAIISKIASGAITYFYLKADANNTSTFFKCEANPKIEITYTK